MASILEVSALHGHGAGSSLKERIGTTRTQRQLDFHRLAFCELKKCFWAAHENSKWATYYDNEAERLRRKLHPTKRQPAPLCTGKIRAEIQEWARLALEREGIERASTERLNASLALV